MTWQPASRNASAATLEKSAPNTEISTAVLFCLFFSLLLWAMTYRGLYADGSHLFLRILAKHGFHHASQTRITSTFMTQLPVVLAIRFGMRSTADLAMLYTAALAIIPVSCYALSIWIARRESVLFCATIVVIVCCFYPLCFLLVGEGNVYLGLFWLAFVVLMADATQERPAFDLLILLISVAALAAYETSAFFSAILAFLTGRRAVRAGSMGMQVALSAACILYLFGVLCGSYGIIFPRDRVNETGFIDGIRNLPDNSVYLRLLAITALSALVAFLRPTALRLVLGIVLFAGIFVFAIRQLHQSGQLALGYVVYQRAQVYCALFVVVAFVFAGKPRAGTCLKNFHAGVLIPPLIAVFAIDATDTVGWNDFIARMCTELSVGNDSSQAAFFGDPATSRYGVNWTFPTMSVLLERWPNHRILMQPGYSGWQPFDPRRPPNIGAFKIGETICR